MRHEIYGYHLELHWFCECLVYHLELHFHFTLEEVGFTYLNFMSHMDFSLLLLFSVFVGSPDIRLKTNP